MDIEQLRNLCLSLPAATEDIKWGADLCFCIGAKMFCVTGVNSNGAASFKVLDEEFEEMTQREGIIPAPYMARNKWVYVQGPQYLSDKEWEKYVRQSYQLVASKLPKKMQKELGLI
jgi:predicted DNA-binding protein (MmcQ/YjbR family)